MIGLLYIGTVLTTLLSCKFQDPIFYGAIEDFTKKNTEKLRKYLNYYIICSVTIMLSFVYVLLKDIVIYDYVSFVAVFIIIIAKLLKKDKESILFGFSSFYILFYSMIRLGFLLI